MVVFGQRTLNLNRTVKVNVMKNYVKSEAYVNGKRIKHFINVLIALIALMCQIQDILLLFVNPLILLVFGNKTKKYIP